MHDKYAQEFVCPLFNTILGQKIATRNFHFSASNAY